MVALAEKNGIGAYPESEHPNDITYVRLDQQIGIGPYEMKHSNLALHDELFDHLPISGEASTSKYSFCRHSAR